MLDLISDLHKQIEKRHLNPDDLIAFTQGYIDGIPEFQILEDFLNLYCDLRNDYDNHNPWDNMFKYPTLSVSDLSCVQSFPENMDSSSRKLHDRVKGKVFGECPQWRDNNADVEK